MGIIFLDYIQNTVICIKDYFSPFYLTESVTVFAAEPGLFSTDKTILQHFAVLNMYR